MPGPERIPDSDGDVDEVQADPFDDPGAEILDGEDAPVNLAGSEEDPR